MKKKQTPKPTRLTLAKRIKAEPNIRKKLDIAFGRAMRLPFWRKQESKLEIISFLRNAQSLANKFVGKTPAVIQAKVKNYSQIGFNLYPVLAAIADNDHKFFSDLADMIKYRRELDEPDDIKQDILTFCARNGCGTIQKPADARELTDYLMSKGHTFSHSVAYVPPTLRVRCRRIGIVLTAQR